MLAFFNTKKIMACAILSGRTEPCKDSLGGLKRAIFINYIQDAFTVAAGAATAINIGVTEVFEYELRADGNTFTQSIVGDRNNGTTVNTQTASLVLKKQDLATANEIKLMAYSRPLIVVQDRNDVYHVLGHTEGCDLSGSDITSGGAKGDFNGYNLTFTAMEGVLAPILDAATITALDGLVSATNIAP